MGQWADEIIERSPNYEPDPELEPFYILAALEFGDPDQDRRLHDNTTKFYALYEKYWQNTECPSYSKQKVILQYVFWYEKSRPSVDSDLNRRSTRS